MNNLDFIDWYVEVNILLAIFWIICFLSTILFKNLNLKPRPNLRLTVSRIFFTSFLLCPLLAGPVSELTSKKITVGVLEQSIVLKKALISDLVITNNMELATNIVTSKGSLTDAFVYVLIVGLFVRLLLSFKSAIKLAVLVSRGYPWKKIGKLHVIISDKIAVPFSTVILGRYHIVIPVFLLTKPKDLRIAIRHEGQHHKNLDTWWVLILELTKIVFFWNPFIYLWVSNFEILHEYACDETLLSKKKISSSEYGNTLIWFAESVSNTRYRLTGAVSMDIKSLFFSSQLKRRIQMFSSYQKSNLSPFRPVILSIPLVLICFTVAFAINGSTSDTQSGMVTFKSTSNKTAVNISQDQKGEQIKKSGMLSLAPAAGFISSRYGNRLDPFSGKAGFHKGIDISNLEDTPIFAPAAGVIIEQQRVHHIHGKLLIIDHGNRIVTRYSHLSTFEKKPGQKVAKGELIARMGNSGRSTAPHLHYEILINDSHVDPENYISKSMKSLAAQIANEIISIREKFVALDNEGMRVSFSDPGFFRPGSAELMKSSIQELEKLTRILYVIPNSVIIEGHTDNIPNKDSRYNSNWELSSARAAAVANLFEQLGIDNERLKIVAYGSTRPKVENVSVGSKKINCRIDILIEP